MPLREREDIMMNRMRRLAPAIAVLAAVGMLTGCSGKGGESGNNKVDTENESTAQKAQGPEKNAASREAEEGMRTVETDKGQVEIPRIPCRIRFWRIRQRESGRWTLQARRLPWK